MKLYGESMLGVWRKMRAAVRLGSVMAYAAPLLLMQGLVAGPVFRNYDTVPRLLKRGIQKIASISVIFNGAATGDRPTLFAANHMSYLDIIMLGAYLPGAFVAKKDVRDWPVVGRAGAATKTIFIERRIGTLRRDQRQIVETLNSGRNVILFPEGTTGDGTDLLPFKGGLLCVAFNNVSRVRLEREIQVQPVSLRVTHVNGRAIERDPELLNNYAWVGGQNIAKHFWRLAQTDNMNLVITVHEPMNPQDYADRRIFTRAVQDKVASGCILPIRS